MNSPGKGREGRIIGISGPTVIARGLESPAMYNLVRVGHPGLIGEVIRLDGEDVTIQVYEETEGLGLGEPVEDSCSPLSVELGPGLLGSLFDGIQRPLDIIREKCGSFIERGAGTDPLSRDSRWDFSPRTAEGDYLKAGDIIGTVMETSAVEHRLLVPLGMEGRAVSIGSGPLAADDPLVILEDGREIPLCHRWPVRAARPVSRKLDPDTLFVTGQRVLDTFFPLAEGGTAILPGGFGTGKTVVQHSLAKFAAADIIVFVGCGERGNEITEVLSSLPALKDPLHGRPLSERTVLIANTSNMPVAAREASLYTGVTIAEYYRDQGYRVALMADSTSRWAEALREISSRLEELPGEEGYPTYLSNRISGFTERAGRVRCLGKEVREGSVTMICTVSPPGGDFSEPVTQSSMRVAGAFWALDSSLAHRRHFPAVNPRTSYSLYLDHLGPHLSTSVSPDWMENARRAMTLLQKEDELQEVVQLVGIDSIPDRERFVLETGKVLRETFLSQNAFRDHDAFCSLKKQFLLLEALLSIHKKAVSAVDSGCSLEKILELPIREHAARLRDLPEEKFADACRETLGRVTLMLEETCPSKGSPPPDEKETA